MKLDTGSIGRARARNAAGMRAEGYPFWFIRAWFHCRGNHEARAIVARGERLRRQATKHTD